MRATHEVRRSSGPKWGWRPCTWCQTPVELGTSWQFSICDPVGWPSSFSLGGLALSCSIIVLTSTQVLPTDGANCRVSIWGVSFTVDVSEPKPNRPNTMNFVEKRAQELGLCEDFVNGRAGSLGSRIVNGVVGGGQSPSSGLVRGWVLLLLLWYYTTRAFWCLPNCRPPLREISLVIYYSAPFILAVHLSIVQVVTWVSVPSSASLNLLWVAVDRMALFRGHSFINAARLPAVGI